MMNKGAALNRRVWTLFERAGFQTEPNSQSQTEHQVQLAIGKKRKVDLFAAETNLGVTIIASNKSGGVKDSWTAHVNDWEVIGQKEDKQALHGSFVACRFSKSACAVQQTTIAVAAFIS